MLRLPVWRRFLAAMIAAMREETAAESFLRFIFFRFDLFFFLAKASSPFAIIVCSQAAPLLLSRVFRFKSPFLYIYYFILFYFVLNSEAAGQ